MHRPMLRALKPHTHNCIQGKRVGQMHRPMLRALKLNHITVDDAVKQSDASPDVEGIETVVRTCTA